MEEFVGILSTEIFTKLSVGRCEVHFKAIKIKNHINTTHWYSLIAQLEHVKEFETNPEVIFLFILQRFVLRLRKAIVTH